MGAPGAGQQTRAKDTDRNKMVIKREKTLPQSDHNKRKRPQNCLKERAPQKWLELNNKDIK